MGDRCYMSVTCRRQDKARFEELGFVVEFDENKNTPAIEMVDEQANYAHNDQMPAEIPYYGSYGSGSNYGPGFVVCDGKLYEEVPASNDGFVVEWNHRLNKPTLQSLNRIRRYLRIEKRVKKRFKALEIRKEHLFSTETHNCIKCGISAGDDAVENTPCPKGGS